MVNGVLKERSQHDPNMAAANMTQSDLGYFRQGCLRRAPVPPPGLNLFRDSYPPHREFRGGARTPADYQA